MQIDGASTADLVHDFGTRHIRFGFRRIGRKARGEKESCSQRLSHHPVCSLVAGRHLTHHVRCGDISIPRGGQGLCTRYRRSGYARHGPAPPAGKSIGHYFTRRLGCLSLNEWLAMGHRRDRIVPLCRRPADGELAEAVDHVVQSSTATQCHTRILKR